MKTKLITIIISLLMLTACAPENPHEQVEESSEQQEWQERFVTFEIKSFHYKLVYDRETLVEYFYAPAGYGSNSGSDFLTPLLDADGKPKLHNQKSDKYIQ